MSNDVHAPPRSVAPAPRLSGKGLLVLLLLVCLFPLTTLSLYAVLYGRASEQKLPVEVQIDRRPLPVLGSDRSMLADVVAVRNCSNHVIENVTMNLNGQYFLYQDDPIAVGETLVVRQEAFATKSSQFWESGSYPITKIIVTGRLPSGARGVTEVRF